MNKTRVLIVDDSALVRSVISELLANDPSIEVAGTAVDPYDARDKIKQLKPDVLTLDIEMPRMDGITFLRNLMKLNPMPVVMLSTLTHAGAEVTLQALELGAVDFIAKPKATDQSHILAVFESELCNKVKTAAASASKLKFHRKPVAERHLRQAPQIGPVSDILGGKQQVIAIGASTGGTEALAELLIQLPNNIPPIIVTQHIPASFSERFARRLNKLCSLTVKQAEEGDILQPGCVYIAPGSHHLQIRKQGHQLICNLNNGAEVNRHKPSVEVMFDSLLEVTPFKVSAMMLTGMGKDGAKAMKRLFDSGAHTIVQDEASSLVWGMPGAAAKYGAAKEIVSLQKMPAKLTKHLSS
ncbi:protein-glutamate methylesterase/protein-glutamine glutaminase [Amphritea sp. HPY]|uniref:protein-glutamate methylesterase/protein-glutamine glutaminase n=1 Tax=Amphritea sp. HPY TaxID=3421652 RepID=UPI003D7C6E86